jgi:uncharacterized OB-fold protein
MTTELNKEIKPLTAQDIAGIRDRWTVRGRYYLAQCEKCGYTGSSEGFHSDGEDIRCPRCRQEHVAEVSQDAYPVVALLATIEAKDRERDTYAEQLAGALALLAETRRVLDEILTLASSTGDGGEWMDAHADVVQTCGEALSLTPPQALCEREERTATLERAVRAGQQLAKVASANTSDEAILEACDVFWNDQAVVSLDAAMKGGQA